MGKSQAALGNPVGRNRASEILNRIRPLTLEMIRTISKQWNIPIDALMAQYELVGIRLNSEGPPKRAFIIPVRLRDIREWLTRDKPPAQPGSLTTPPLSFAWSLSSNASALLLILRSIGSIFRSAI